MYGRSLFIRSKLARNDIEKYLAESPSYLIFRSIIMVHNNNLVLLIICNEGMSSWPLFYQSSYQFN